MIIRYLFIVLFSFLFTKPLSVNAQTLETVDVTSPQGDRYIGEVLNGQRHGKGKYIQKNGEIYEGEWKNGNPHGTGILTSANGNRWEGGMSAGQMDGKGKLTLADGTIYEGEMSMGKFHGKGILIEGGHKYEGEFFMGEMHGDGKLTLKDGKIVKGYFYRGKYAENMKQKERESEEFFKNIEEKREKQREASRKAEKKAEEERLKRKAEGLGEGERVDWVITDKQAEYNKIIYHRDGSIPNSGMDKSSGSRGWYVADEFKDVVSNVIQKKDCSIEFLELSDCADPKKKSVSKQLIRNEFALTSKIYSTDGYGGNFCSINRTYRCSGKQEYIIYSDDQMGKGNFGRGPVSWRNAKRTAIPYVEKATKNFLYCPEEKFITPFTSDEFGEQSFVHLRKIDDSDTKLKVTIPYKDEYSKTIGMHGFRTISFDKKNEYITEVSKIDALVPYNLDKNTLGGRPPKRNTFSGQCERFLTSGFLKCSMEKKEKREKKYSHNYKVDSDLNFFGMLDEHKELKGNENLLKKYKENFRTEITDEELKIKNLSTGFYTVKLNLKNGDVVLFGSNEDEIINRGQCSP